VKRIALALFGLVVACGGELVSSDEPGDASLEAAPSPYAAECVGEAVPPNDLKCTGLYTDVANKTLAPGIRPYAPAVPLWADTAEKSRWIYLPPGTKIDATDPNEWIFPVGTKVWKEFVRDSIVVETRLWQKIEQGFWVRGTYRWNTALTEATLSAGGDIPWGTDGGIYHIPTPDECDQCHKGRVDHLLGFEQVSLGLAGATGLTLSELVKQDLITPVPSSTNLTVGDDGTGVAAAPLKWLHINCGTTCHNDNSNSTAFGASMRLRLDPTLLDGRSSVDFPSRVTTLGVKATTPAWSGKPRIIPSDPTHSLVIELITNRGTDNPVANQMPPIATLLVDVNDATMIADWISKMPPLPVEAGTSSGSEAGVDATVSQDAGPDDATVDAASDAADGSPDESADDAGSEAAANDASPEGALPDAGVDSGPDSPAGEN
jgi:hypothetical protein